MTDHALVIAKALLRWIDKPGEHRIRCPVCHRRRFRITVEVGSAGGYCYGPGIDGPYCINWCMQSRSQLTELAVAGGGLEK